MRRPSTSAVAGVACAALVVAMIAACGASDGSPAAELEAPACEPGATDRNPDNARVQPSRGERLTPQRSGHLPIGFNDPAYLNGQLDLEQTIELHRAAGSTVWRLPLDWGAVERSPGEFDFSQYDEIYCAAVAGGLQPLWTVTGVPVWAVPDGTCAQVPCVRPPEEEHLTALRRFSELAAIRYPRSAAFEAWNEPNFRSFWGGPPDPSIYVSILKEIYGGVKDADPEMPVLGGSLTNPDDDPVTGNLSVSSYLQAMLDAGAASSMDGFSLHPYPIGEPGADGDLFTPTLSAATDLLDGAGEGDMRIWITETGAPTASGAFAPQVSPQEQAQFLARIYADLEVADRVDAMIVHTLVDPGEGVPGGPGFGVFTAPGDSGVVTAKPAACVLRELTGAEPGPCPRTLRL